MVGPGPASAAGLLQHGRPYHQVAFVFGASEELSEEAMAVLTLVGLGGGLRLSWW